MKPHKSKSPMMLIAPTITPKFIPKLHYHPLHPQSHFLFHPKQLQISQTNMTIIATHKSNHHKRYTTVNMASEKGSRWDVMVNEWREVKLDKYDMMAAAAVMGMHLLCGFAPFMFSWRALQVAIGLDFASRFLGINVSFHRHLTHKSFKVPKWLEYAFAYCGVHALQGTPISWVRTHRFHHLYSDTERDPHTPTKGFWFSHVLWMFDSTNKVNMIGGQNNVRDLEKQFFYRFIEKTYVAHPIALALVLYGLGGLPFIVWGMAVRVVWGYHMTWLVNSVCHGLGDQKWNTRDLSLNNGWIGILGYGDGWHHNHHAFKYSARHGLEWWQVDITWYLIRLLEIIGVASNVKLPTQAHIQRMTLHAKDPSS